MIKIIALNNAAEASNEEEENVVTQEAQESIAESEYIRAIKMKSDGQIDLCLHLLKELLQTQVLNENIKNNCNDKLWIIKYNCHKNIALILEQRFEYMLALQHYISAILIDSTDISTLHRFGQLALQLQATDLAEYAFENCISRNSAHWCGGEGMLNVMNVNYNILGSYICAKKIFKQNSSSEIAAETLKELVNLFKSNLHFLKLCSGPDSHSSFNKECQKQFKYVFREANIINHTVEQKIVRMPDLRDFHIKDISWMSIGQFILDIYLHLRQSTHDMFFEFNLNTFIKNNDDLLTSNITKETLKATTENLDKMQSVAQDLDCNFNCDENIIDHSKKTDLQSLEYNNSDSESNIKSDGYEVIKAKPRRRCSDLHFLEQWGWHKNRRYSSRKKNERDDIDSSLNGYLQKVFVKYTKLSFDDKWPFNTSRSEVIANSECCYCQMRFSDDLFNLNTLKELEKFTKEFKAKNVDLTQLAYLWLKYMSLSWSLPLPRSLKVLYIDIFQIYISHDDFTTWNQLSPSNYEECFRICMLFLELSVKSHIINNSDLWRKVFHQLLFNIGNCHITSAGSFETYRLKLMYFEFMLLSNNLHYNECLLCLQQIHEILQQYDSSYILHIPNLEHVCISINYIKNLQLKYKRQMDVRNIPKLYEDESWEILVNIISANIESIENQYYNEYWLKDICAQVEILLYSFWSMASYENCLIWAEKSLHFAVSHYLQESKAAPRFTLFAQLINFVTSYIEAIILNKGFHIVAALKKEDMCRMAQNIIRILVYQFEGTFEKNSIHGRDINFKHPWVILHQLVLREENDTPNQFHTKNHELQDINELIPESFLVLFTAHEYLGKRQWCTDDNGEFLEYILDAVVHNFKAPVYDVCRDIIFEYLEQVTYCLYKYPQKKARLRYLEDHEASAVQLSWRKAVQVFDLYHPENLPEFNSYKLESITSDMEQFLLKIISLMPKEVDPSNSVHYITMFVEGHLETPPKDFNTFKFPYKVLNLYYLLADYYFKTRDFAKAVKFYTLDLAVNPTRFDSWAGMALSKASKIETKLNGLDPISMETFWEECEEVLRCFECCINLNRFQTLLWIEYGSFSYTIHSFFSRYEKSSFKNLSSDTYCLISERKNKMLTTAYNCFSLVNSIQNSMTAVEDNSDANDEKWLCQYMLGKISEKRKEEPKAYLNYYLMAANYLYESGASYPIKINHSNPTMLSVEALEVFYRINASIIKYLQSEKQISRCNGELFSKILKNLSSSPFAYNKAKIDGNSLNILKGKIINGPKPSLNYIVKPDFTLPDHSKIYSNEALKRADDFQFEKKRENEKNSTQIMKECMYSRKSATDASTGATAEMLSDNSSVESESESDESFTDNEDSNIIKDGMFAVDELKNLYRMVVQNIEECATRFPEHYKSIFRLVHHYMYSPAEYRDIALSEQLLLGQYKTSLGNLINGIFYDRKNYNLFNGIWRIPSSEIDRPGSFAAHLRKCVKIFIQLLFKIKNHSVLVDVAINLYKTPDMDKRYITDVERKDLCHKSICYSLEILRSTLKNNMDHRNDTEILNLLIDIYKIHKKCVKHMYQKEPIFSELLVDVYKFFIRDKVDSVPESCNLLDLAIKFCVQEITAQKTMEKCSPVDNVSMASTYNIMQSSQSATARDATDLKLFIDEYYAKMIQNGSNIFSGANWIPQNQRNHEKDQTSLNISNTINLFLPQFSSVPSALESSNKLNIDDSVATLCNDTSLHAEVTRCSSKQQLRVKSSSKNKPMFKPYNHPTDSKSSQSDSNGSYNNYGKVFSAYSNLQRTTAMSQIALSNEHFGPDLKKSTLVETSGDLTSMTSNEYHNDLNVTNTLQISSSCFSSTSQILNKFSNQEMCSRNGVNPIKTLQEKLADRQRAYQLNDTNPESSLSTSAKDVLIDDVIILD